MPQYSDIYREDRLEHWKREIETACEAGKTVVILLVEPQEGQADSGGRISSYSAIPIRSLEFVPAVGHKIRIVGQPRYLSEYWREFSSFSRYQGYLEANFGQADVILKTASGDRVVGAAIQCGRGTLILVPPLCPPNHFHAAVGGSPDERAKFDHILFRTLVAVHRAIHSDTSVMPPPDWVSDPAYRLGREDKLQADIRATSSKIETLQSEQRTLEGEIKQVRALRRLLYEQGEQLEEVILDVLKLFGFEAESYRDADSEFDAVFTSAEGRFLGEAEGKDRRPIDIRKLRQLIDNLEEDFARDEIEEYAKGVLFGNSHRLQPLNKRPVDFTTKCYTSAKRSKIALVRTADMFEPARYLSEHDDPDYARLCREAIRQCAGEVVVFPPPPSG